LFAPKSGTRPGCSFFSLLFNTVLEFLARAINQEKEIKGIQIRKEEVKLFLFAYDIILVILPPNSYICTSSNVARYKINIQKSEGFLHTNNAQAEKEIRKTISFTIASIK
jgi:hypothetical protein